MRKQNLLQTCTEAQEALALFHPVVNQCRGGAYARAVTSSLRCLYALSTMVTHF